MKIERLIIGFLQTNTYFVYDENTKDCFLVDPAAQSERILEYAQEKGWNIGGILLTHGHFDHIGAVEALKKKINVPVYAYYEEEEVLTGPANLASMMNREMRVEATNYVADKEEIRLGNMQFRVIHTPGHTKGGCCYYAEAEKILISGDTMFCGSYGRYDFPTGSYNSLIRSIKERLLVLPEDVKVYPGHGDETSIGFERNNYL